MSARPLETRRTRGAGTGKPVRALCPKRRKRTGDMESGSTNV